MSSEHVDHIRAKLLTASEEAHLYVILDGASVPDLWQRLTTPDLSSVCLLRGELDSELAQVAPYLMELDRQPALLDWILTEGWGKHWGIFLITEATFRAVRQHSRSLLQVYSPEDEPLFFRFYDPRVLRAFLPTCDRDQLADLFGPIKRYCMEAEDGDSMLEYEFNDGALVCL